MRSRVRSRRFRPILLLALPLLALASCRGEEEPGHLHRFVSLEWLKGETHTVAIDGDARPAIEIEPASPRLWTVEGSSNDRTLELAVGLAEKPPRSTTTRFDFEVVARRTGQEDLVESAGFRAATWSVKPAWIPISLSIPAGEQSVELEVRVLVSKESDDLPTPVITRPQLSAIEPGRATQPNIVLLSIDTLRADRLSLYGYEKSTSPNIDRRAAESGVTFFNAIAAAPWTLPSHVTMLTGEEPTRHGANRPMKAPDHGISLAHRLSAHGYQSIAFTAGGYLSPEFDVVRGFDRQLNRDYEGNESEGELEAGLESLSSWLKERPTEPFFAFFHTYEVHSPYLAREPYFSKLAPGITIPPKRKAILKAKSAKHTNPTDRIVIPTERWSDYERPDEQGVVDLVNALYDSGVAFTDEQLELLWDVLDATGFAENTIVVLTSDHGEALGEHGRIGHETLYDTVLRVPLIFWLPEGRPHQSERQARAVDLVPSLLSLAGIPLSGDLIGQPLIISGAPAEPTSRTEPAWSYAGAKGISARIDNRGKYIWRPKTDSRAESEEEYYDLSVDPEEGQDLHEGSADPDARFLTSARRKLATELPGLHTQWANPTDRDIEVTVRGDVLVERTMISLDCPQLERAGVAVITINLPSGVECDTVLEQLAPSTLEVTVEGETLSLDLSDRDLQEHEWGDGVAVSASWVGERAGESTEAEMSEGLEEQLRALGYLN